MIPNSSFPSLRTPLVSILPPPPPHTPPFSSTQNNAGVYRNINAHTRRSETGGHPCHFSTDTNTCTAPIHTHTTADAHTRTPTPTHAHTHTRVNVCVREYMFVIARISVVYSLLMYSLMHAPIFVYCAGRELQAMTADLSAIRGRFEGLL